MAKTSFDPFLHGYRFQNGSPMPAQVSAAAAAGAFFTFGVAPAIAASIGFNVVAVGVCGGMSWSALDFFHYAKERVPGYDNQSFPQMVLVRGIRMQAGSSCLYDYVWKRQVDSAKANGGGFLLAVTQAPRTSENYMRAKALLDVGQPVPIALPARSNLIWEGHHVVAFDYQEIGGRRELIVYDCNDPTSPQMLRINTEDDVDAFATTLSETTGQWVEGAPAGTPKWKGFWIADGYQPETPPTDLDDIILIGDVTAPPASNSQAPFNVSFSVANVGEFETLLHSVGIRIGGTVLPGRVEVLGGRLSVGQSFKAEIEVQLLAGTHEIEPVYFTGLNHPPRSLGTKRRISVAVAFPAGSWLNLGALGPGPAASMVLGDLLSGPTLLQPTLPRIYEVEEYKLGVKVWVEDDLGGGVFKEPIKSVTAKLDNGTLRAVKITSGAREATIEAVFDPIPGEGTTLLRVWVRDDADQVFDKVMSVSCAEQVTIRHIDLNHVVPDLGNDPFGPLRGLGGIIINPINPRPFR